MDLAEREGRGCSTPAPYAVLLQSPLYGVPSSLTHPARSATLRAVERTYRRIAREREQGGVASLGERVGYRIGQFGRALSPRVVARDRALAGAALTPAQLIAFRLMSPSDQRHAARVARALLAEGARDPDLLVAALLHDLGKIDERGHGRVRLPHRVSKVALQRLTPGLWRCLGGPARQGPTRGYYLLREHPALGAVWAARLGVSPRACALIAAHQDGDDSADQDAAFNALLGRLRATDDRS